MKKIGLAWMRSAGHAMSASFYISVGRALVRAASCIVISIVVFSGVAFLSCMGIAVLSPILQGCMLLMPPCIAMLASPLYTPFLVRSFVGHDSDTSFHWGVSLRWTLGSYAIVLGVGALLCLIYREGSIELLLAAACCLGVIAPFVLIKLVVFPVAGVAVLFRPMNESSSKKLWKHARTMTWHELPFIIWLLCALMPVSIGSYNLLAWLVCRHYMSSYVAGMIMHGVTMLCWEIGWVAFMVFYQQRKHLYLK